MMSRKPSHFTKWVGVMCVLVCLFLSAYPLTSHAQAAERAASLTWWGAIVAQVTNVIQLAVETLDRVFDGEALLVAQVGGVLDETLPPADVVPSTLTPALLAGDLPGQIVINTPLAVDNVLTVNGSVTLATTTLTGGLNGTTATFSGTLGAGGVTAGFVTVGGGVSIGGALDVGGGITTNGADVDLEGGELFASNVVNEVVAGDNVTITGTVNRPVISFEQFDGVETINGQRGVVTFRGDDDIEISGTTIRNESDLASVRSRGGCTGCVNDTDVANTLTLTGGTINGVVIGEATRADAYFANTFIGTTTATATLTIAGTLTTTEAISINASATSTVAGGLNVTGGCVAVNGVCIGGASNITGLSDVDTSGAVLGSILQYDGAQWVSATTAIGIDTYLELTDTPSVFATSSIIFTNASGTGLTQATDFVYTNAGFLGVGTSSPLERLSVGGNVGLLAQNAMRFYDTDNSGYVGFRASSSVTGSTVWTLPATDGGADQVLVTDGAGNLSFTDLSALGIVQSYTDLDDTPSSLVANAIQFASSTGTSLTQSSLFVFDGSNLAIGTTTALDRLSVEGDAGFLSGGAARFYNSSNNYYVALQASTSLSTNTNWYLPAADGTTDQVLVTDGAGNLRFDDVSALGTSVRNYVELLDTPSSLTAYSIPFASSTGNELTQDSDFVYREGNVGIGTNTPGETLVVDGSVRFTSPTNGGETDFLYNESTQRISIGTASAANKLTLIGGSMFQAAGDSSNIFQPNTITSISLGATINDVEISGSYMYAVSEVADDDFHVVDISNRNAPSEVIGIDLGADTNGVDIKGRYAYAVSDIAGNDFHVIDISNPLSPSEVAGLNLTTSATDVAVQGNYAYVTIEAAVSSFQVIDISNPLAPTFVASTSLGTSLNAVKVRGDYAYVVSQTSGDDFHVIDISDPMNPTEVDSLPLDDSANDIAIQGDYAYVGVNSTGDDLFVIDISDPTNISEVNAVNLATGVRGVSVVGRHLYTAAIGGSNDFSIFDIGSGASLTRVGSVSAGLGNLSGVTAIGNRAFVYASQLRVFNITGIETQSLVAGTAQVTSLVANSQVNFYDDLIVSGAISGLGAIEISDSLTVRGSDTSSFIGGLTVGTTTSATSSILTVDGSITATNLYGGSTGLSTDATGKIIRDPSDVRLKTNITDVENALDILLELRGVRYQWIDKERFGYQTEVGFIAQEVYQVLPEVVRTGGEYWSLNTQNILAIVVEAIQEIWVEIQGNKERITALEEQLQAVQGGTSTSSPDADEETEDVDTVVESNETEEEQTTPTNSGNNENVREDSNEEELREDTPSQASASSSATSTPDILMENEISATSSAESGDTEEITTASEPETKGTTTPSGIDEAVTEQSLGEAGDVDVLGETDVDTGDNNGTQNDATDDMQTSAEQISNEIQPDAEVDNEESI